MASLIIVGGGMQGLFLLHEALARGVDAILFTKGGVGEGESHHSHAMMTGGSWCSADPNLEEMISSSRLIREMFPHAIQNSKFYAAVDPSGSPSPFSIDTLGAFWKAKGLHLTEVPSSDIGPEFVGGYEAMKKKVFRSEIDGNFKDSEVTGALLKLHHDKIFQGELVDVEVDKEHSRVVSASFKAADGTVVKFHPHELVLATGAWTPRLVHNAVNDEATRTALLEPLKTLKGKLLPMIIIRGKELPYVTCFSPSSGVAWGCYKYDNGDVEWYMTPSAALMKSIPYTTELNPDVEPETPTQMIKATLDAALNICPGLKAKLNTFQFSVFSGYRTEHPTEHERPPRSSVTRLASNLHVVLPGMWQNGPSGAKRYFNEHAAKDHKAHGHDKESLKKFSAAKLAPRKAETCPYLSYDAFVAKHKL